MPKRIQRKRTKGWRMPPNTVYVGRPTKWGNSYRLGNAPPYMFSREQERRIVIAKYSDWLVESGAMSDIHELTGKDLACWCPLDQPCHADVLLELANNARKR